MYKQRISYADYVEEVERLYKIERREIYFGFVIRDFIQSILTESEPVSYTHLDVYKRQEQTAGKAGSRGRNPPVTGIQGRQPESRTVH